MAGATPKTIPTKAEKPNESSTDHQGTVVVKNLPIIKEIPIPKAIPIIPPSPDKVIASIKNWFLISEGLAPTAFLSPISLVHSVTDTSIIFMIPMPPTTKDIAAIPPRAKVNTPVIWEIVDKACS